MNLNPIQNEFGPYPIILVDNQGMSFLKIKDTSKRDALVVAFLKTKRSIQNDLFRNNW